ncbi:hypothetical protein EUTSA_v10011920mg [Eutrema salsugineum]|uniref:Uncharacterized protein n=1 Tax=Eutrema salsugineum TaxID=72664 RepID=V4JZN6_EUTSA|nr:hypothetical protein EUTSA_v10011920mg [Eutrema salsugineum]
MKRKEIQIFQQTYRKRLQLFVFVLAVVDGIDQLKAVASTNRILLDMEITRHDKDYIFSKYYDPLFSLLRG